MARALWRIIPINAAQMDWRAQRDALLAVGVGAVFSARYFFKQRQLWPFRVCSQHAVPNHKQLVDGRTAHVWNSAAVQISVIVAWPTLGVAVMHTVINNSMPDAVSDRSVIPAGWLHMGSVMLVAGDDTRATCSSLPALRSRCCKTSPATTPRRLRRRGSRTPPSCSACGPLRSATRATAD